MKKLYNDYYETPVLQRELVALTWISLGQTALTREL
jgi:hypothetical protein